MKKYLTFISAILLFSIIFINIDNAGAAGKKIQTKIKTGVYVPKDLIIVNTLPSLPVPASGENYTLLQSIGKVTNIVIAEFLTGKNVTTLITDKNGDGKVDLVAYYYHNTKKFRKQPKPGKKFPPERFKKLKMDILNGIQKEVYPNTEGIPFIKSLIKNVNPYAKLFKVRRGYKLIVYDADHQTRDRLNFLFSNNGVHGFDLAFEVKYYNVRETLVKPVIVFSVYCKGSFDPVITEVTNDLVSFTSDYYIK